MKVEKISRELEQYCREIVEKYKIPGVAMGLAKDEELLWEKGYGYRDVEKELALTIDTVFGIGSITKSFTCVAIMQLQEAGKLSVHDPVINYLPEFKTPDENQTDRITIHHFMTHTAGLPPLPTLFSALKKSMENDSKLETDSEEDALAQLPVIETSDELLAFMAASSYELLGAPGQEFSYSNDCFALLGAIIERVGGQTYEAYVKEHILEPIGMNNSVFHLEELSAHEDVATLYNSRKQDGETIIFASNNPWDAPAMRAAGFLKSTVKDMLKYTEIFRNGGKFGDRQVLSHDSVEQMMTPFIEWSPGRYYGYGVVVIPDFFGYKLVEHSGGIKGVTAQMNIIPELGLTGIGLANLGSVPTAKLLTSTFIDYLGKPFTATPMQVEEIAVAADMLQGYEGRFASGEGMKFAFHVEDGKLVISSEEFSALPLKPIGDDSFLLELLEAETTIRFVRNEEGAVIRVAFGSRQIPKVKDDTE